MTSPKNLTKPETVLGNMSFLAHFGELRKRLLFSVLAVAGATLLCLSEVKNIWAFLLQALPAKASGTGLINIAPMEGLLIDLKVAVVAGVLLASPLLFWQFYRFVAPGLFKNEKRALLPLLFFSTLLFLAGAAFAFWLVIPLSLSFLNAYAQGVAEQSWTQSSYADFITRILLAFSFMFQLPIFTYLLARMGLLTSSFMISQFRLALLIIFVLAALLTPPEVISQFLLAMPLILLYGISILVARLAAPSIAGEK